MGGSDVESVDLRREAARSPRGAAIASATSTRSRSSMRSSRARSRCWASAADCSSSTSRWAARCGRTWRRRCRTRSTTATGRSTSGTRTRRRSSRARRSRAFIPARASSRPTRSITRRSSDLGRNLVVEAWSEPDRIVEAIRWDGPSYVLAVQWHPEFHSARRHLVHRRHAAAGRFPAPRARRRGGVRHLNLTIRSGTPDENRQSRDDGACSPKSPSTAMPPCAASTSSRAPRSRAGRRCR